MLSSTEKAVVPVLLHNRNSSRRTIPQQVEAAAVNSSASSAAGEAGPGEAGPGEGEGDSIASAITVTMDDAVAISAVAADSAAASRADRA
jgi:hypothetical protein